MSAASDISALAPPSAAASSTVGSGSVPQTSATAPDGATSIASGGTITSGSAPSGTDAVDS
eukprot:scaffold24337_cov26-Tisochrysis_lutea.AAC.2